MWNRGTVASCTRLCDGRTGVRGSARFAEAANWPVNLHVTDAKSRPFRDGWRRRARNLCSSLGRGRRCGLFWRTGAAARRCRAGQAAGVANVDYDTAASPLLYGPEIWRRFSAEVRAERVLFGSDFPLHNFPRTTANPEMAQLLAEARGAGLTDSELAAVLHGNAARLLGD